MSAPDPRAHPAAPPSEVEWEDLLVRIEVAPRVLRLAVEDAAGREGVLAPLRSAVMEEVRLQALLESMAGEGRGAGQAASEAAEDDPTRLARRFASLRARTFAIVQRRGLGVWAWRLEGDPWEGATAYQLLQAAAARDGRMLADVRGSAR